MEQNPLTSLYRVVQNRRANPAEGSYTCYLFSQGLDKILKKCGEECAETIIAAKNGILLDTENEICFKIIADFCSFYDSFFGCIFLDFIKNFIRNGSLF